MPGFARWSVCCRTEVPRETTGVERWVRTVCAGNVLARPVQPLVSVKNGPSAQTIAFIAQCIAETSNENDIGNLSTLGSLMNKNRPEFDSRNYGYAKLSKFLQSIDRFEVMLDKHGHPQVHVRQAKG